MKISKYLFAIVVIASLQMIQVKGQLINNSVKLPAHPRLLCLQGEEKNLTANIGIDKNWDKIHQSILEDCEQMIDLLPVERIKIGKRLLDKSREALRRIFYLSYAYRTTRHEKYLQRAEKEMLAIATFSDWNPTHFLDVGEMTMAMAIGYDWLYNGLSDDSRFVIKEAILKKGIEPSLKPEYSSWLKATHNWNQVCNAGIAYGALATYEDHPELSMQIINRAIETIDLPMQDYAPDGAYPEGYGYWGYGTSFNVMFISALETAFGKNFGLTQKPGFMQTPFYMENITGPSGKPYNYSDCGVNAEFNPAMFWFASRLKNPSLLWIEKLQLIANMPLKNRLLPAVMIWGKGIQIAKIQAPKSMIWVGRGSNPVAFMRTSWINPSAIYVGFKGGSPSVNHAHMDAGSFIMEADGIRWAMDFGMQGYESLESKGIDLWNRTQNSQRWKVFRYNNFAHNTLSINNEFQLVQGSANIVSHSTSPLFTNAIADITSLYADKVSNLRRGIAIVEKKYVVVMDEIETGSESITVRWSMVTPAEIELTDKNTAILTKNGKKLLLKVQGAGSITMKSWSTEPTTDYDAPNPGTQIVGFETVLPANSKVALQVFLIPQKAQNKIIKTIKPLTSWPK